MLVLVVVVALVLALELAELLAGGCLVAGSCLVGCSQDLLAAFALNSSPPTRPVLCAFGARRDLKVPRRAVGSRVLVVGVVVVVIVVALVIALEFAELLAGGFLVGGGVLGRCSQDRSAA